VNTAKWFAIMVMVVVGEMLVFDAFVVNSTGSIDGLTAVGEMVASVIKAFTSW
jgi:hypothetical protein